MVKFYVDTITEDVINAAKTLSQAQKEVVNIITPTETLEVSYEKESEKEKSLEI